MIDNQNEKLIPMNELKPLEFAIATEGYCKGHIVMRTASTNKFEVINISRFEENICWTDGDVDLLVQRINVDIIIKIKGE
jgi:hypothetical protein